MLIKLFLPFESPCRDVEKVLLTAEYAKPSFATTFAKATVVKDGYGE